MDFYNLDAIIAVGYRVNSREATQFRIWATQVLREYLIKGFVMDDERLKQNTRLYRPPNPTSPAILPHFDISMVIHTLHGHTNQGETGELGRK